MSLKGLVGQTWQDKASVAYRASQTYLAATATYTLFNINNGAVLITALGGRITGAAVGATTIRFSINTIFADAAVVAINGAVGLVFVSTLNVAGTLVHLLGVPLTDALLHSKGFIAGTQPAGPGLIVGNFATATSVVAEMFCVYRKLSPTASVTVA